MLLHVVVADCAPGFANFQEAVYAFDLEWFATRFACCFLPYDRVPHADITLEWRAAIEPWNVLGEELGGTNTVHVVDAFFKRLQLKVTGMLEARYVVGCHGRRILLHATGTAHEYVARRRYRAWQPPSCVPPTIPVHTPLVFDMLDTWNQRAMGGGICHVAHPDGHQDDTFPVHTNEAESHRVARFSPCGHTRGPREMPPEETNPHCPYTLDLRRHHHMLSLSTSRLL